jgi:hypothetical protein
VWPIGRTIAGFSVRAEAKVSDSSCLALKLSKNTAGRASVNTDASRLSNSSALWPLVNADGLLPLAIIQIALTSSPLPVPAPL